MKRSPVAAGWGRTLRRRPEIEARASTMQDYMRATPIEVWGSRDFLVAIYPDGLGERITVNRTVLTPRGDRWLDGITWDELQAIKREIGRGDRWAVEVYPADEHVVNVSNMRHLFVLPERPEYAWTVHP